jgi:hypothetical protein
MQQMEFIFLRYFALHVSGATFTHHQEPQLYKRVWCNCINLQYIVIADLNSYSIPAFLVEAPDDG